MNNLIILLLTLLIKLQYSLWLGKNGICLYLLIKKDINTLKMTNDKLKLRNNQFFNKIKELNKDQEALEEFARNELGMIKQGETFYRLVQ